MGQLGIGVMLNLLAGGESGDVRELVGRKIKQCEIPTDGLDSQVNILFEDGVQLVFWDNGRSCCESRYASTDDDLSQFIGSTFVGLTTKEAETKDEGGEEHETVFVEVLTDIGPITIVNHNEHNGYYGGFSLTMKIKGTQAAHQGEKEGM